MMPQQRELRDLIAAKMSDCLAEMASEFIGEERLADAVMELFHDVRDDWDHIDISTFGEEPGSHFHDQRWLIARVPREAQDRRLPAPDRTRPA